MDGATRWSSTLSTKVSLHHAIGFRALCANLGTCPAEFPRKVSINPLCKSQFPHKSANLPLIVIKIYDKLTDLSGN